MFCSKCGKEVGSDDLFCSKCGASLQPQTTQVQSVNVVVGEKKEENNNGLQLVAKIFMILSCVFTGFWIIPLAWTIPMTVVYHNKVKNNEKVGMGFKICTLLFVNTIAGILMLCADAE